MIPTGITYDFIKSLYDQKNYVFRQDNEFVNIFGYRSKDLVTVDHFNDLLGIAYRDLYGNKQCLIFPGTTKPGLYYLTKELGNPEGTFIMAPSQYLNCWREGVHVKYQALIQSGPGVFKGWRDKDADGKLDMNGPIYNDSSGVNLHTVRTDSDVNDVVYNASSGCQVIRDGHNFEAVLNLVLRGMNTLNIQTTNYCLFQES